MRIFDHCQRLMAGEKPTLETTVMGENWISAPGFRFTHTPTSDHVYMVEPDGTKVVLTQYLDGRISATAIDLDWAVIYREIGSRREYHGRNITQDIIDQATFDATYPQWVLGHSQRENIDWEL